MASRSVESKIPSLTSKTVAGIAIDRSDEQYWNTDDSMRKSLEPGSNATLKSAVHRSKHSMPRMLTEDGMQIDESDEQFENACDPIRESVEPDSNVTLESAAH
jgi:hypothetical protein